MDIAIERLQDVAVIEVPYEEIDASNAAEFKHALAAVVSTEPRLIFDLHRLRFVDSSGLGSFLSCLRKVNEHGGELKLCGMATAVRAVFELVRMHRVFDIHPTRDAALAAFTPAAPDAVAAVPRGPA